MIRERIMACRLSKIAAAALMLAAMGACKPDEAVSRPPENGYYRIPLTDNPVSLDPARFTDVNSDGVARRIFNTLVKLDSDLRPAPDLAESWQVSDDGLTYTFKLRRGVRFHNGREVTVADVIYSFERLLDARTASPRAWVLEAIEGAPEMRKGQAERLRGIGAPDTRTIIIRLREPFGPFLNLLTITNAAIVPKEEIEASGDAFGKQPVGTGPFKFGSWLNNDTIELERNDGYFAGPAKISGLRFRVIKESLIAYREYLAGNFEHCAVPEGYLPEIRRGPLAAEVLSTNTLSTYYLGLMMTHEPWGSNVHLRRAINYAIDRNFICNELLGGSHAPARGVLPPGLSAYNPELEGYTYDPARARQELALAGYGQMNRDEHSPARGGDASAVPNKPVPELTLFFNSRPPGPLVVQAVQEDLRRVGIPVRLRALDMGALFRSVNQMEPDMFRLAWIADFADADNFLYIFHSRMFGASGNRARYSNAEVDNLLDYSRRETDTGKRQAILREAERLIVEDAPWIFLSHSQTHLLVKPYVTGLTLTPMDVGTSVNQVDFRNVSIRKLNP